MAEFSCSCGAHVCRDFDATIIIPDVPERVAQRIMEMNHAMCSSLLVLCKCPYVSNKARSLTENHRNRAPPDNRGWVSSGPHADARSPSTCKGLEGPGTNVAPTYPVPRRGGFHDTHYNADCDMI